MFGKLGDIAGLMKSAKQIQSRMAELQQELGNRRYDGDAGGGLVRATVDGRSSLVAVKIDPKATEDLELLEDLIIAAVGAATSKSQEAMQSEMAAMTGGINLPGLGDIFGGGGAQSPK